MVSNSRHCAFCKSTKGSLAAYNDLSLTAVGGNGASYAHPQCFTAAAEASAKVKTCVDCRKVLSRMLFVCPSCKTKRCWNCWSKHLDSKVCEYGKADKLDVAI